MKVSMVSLRLDLQETDGIFLSYYRTIAIIFTN